MMARPDTMVMNFIDISFLLVVMVLCFMVQAEEFHGRHVCAQQQHISQPIPTRQSYTRAIYRPDLQRIVYQTAYRTVFRMQIRAKLVPGCCPGWEKRSPRDVNCLKPICERECENGGTCVGPGLCMCAKGYTGYRCHIDIDECNMRHQCQQRCTNLPGSYKCSCQEGFKLGADLHSCDLCLSCTEEFQNMQARIETVQETNKADHMFQEIRKEIDTLNEVKKQAGMFSDIQKQLDNLNDITVDDEKFKEIQTEIDDLKEMKTKVNSIQELNDKVENLYAMSLQTDKFDAMQKEIEELNDLKPKVDTVQELSKKVDRLEKDDSRDKKIEELENQVAVLTEMKSKADKMDEMQRDIEKLQEVKKEMDKFADLKKQLEQMSKRIQELETDKAVLKKNLTATMNQYETVVSALSEKEIKTTVTTTPDRYKTDPTMPLDRLASLSEQISILEEKMADCRCNQDYGGYYG